MKKYICLFMVAVLAMIAAGCGGNADVPASSAGSDVTSSDVSSEFESEAPVSSEVSSESESDEPVSSEVSSEAASGQTSSSETSDEEVFNYWENLDSLLFAPSDGNDIYLIPETNQQFFWYETYEIPVEYIIFGDIFGTRYGVKIDSIPDGVEYAGEGLDKTYGDNDLVSYKFVSDKSVSEGQSKDKPIVEVIECSVVPVEGTNEEARSAHPTLHVIHSEYGVFVAKNGEESLIMSYFDWMYKNGHMTRQEYDAARYPYITMTPVS